MTDAARAIVPFGYVRVSSLEQEGGYGPDVQAIAIRGYCVRKAWPVPDIVHESISGESILGRPAIRDLVVRAKAVQESGKHAVIVFHKLDRLARNLMDQESLVMQSMQYGFRFYSTQSAEEDILDPANQGDPARVMIRQIFGAFNQFDRATIQARLDSGLLEKARVGKSTGGRLPFGYRHIGQDIAVDPERVPVVVRVYQLRAGRMLPRAIAEVVVHEYPLLCATWGPMQVTRVLAREDLYRGGMYRTRIGVEAMHRPELVILPNSTSCAQVRTKQVRTTISWDRAPAQIGMTWLALRANLPVGDIQARLADHAGHITWVKGRMLVPKAIAKLVIEQVEKESGSKVPS